MAPHIAPVRKEIEIALSCDEAFRRFTVDISRWWPLADHSVSGDRDASVRFGGGVGEAIVEQSGEGASYPWGTILEWEPPRRVVFSWYPGRSASSAQTIAVSFDPVTGGCRVTLEHIGWEALGDRAESMRADYATGWDLVFVRGYGDPSAG